jgi:hypothetical protein
MGKYREEVDNLCSIANTIRFSHLKKSSMNKVNIASKGIKKPAKENKKLASK